MFVDKHVLIKGRVVNFHDVHVVEVQMLLRIYLFGRIKQYIRRMRYNEVQGIKVIVSLL